MTCKSTKQFKKTKICSKDLRHRVLIQYRETAGTNNLNSDPEPTFTDIGNYWAAIKTTPSRESFNDVNQGSAATTDFYLRYTESIDIFKNLWIIFRDRRFEVLNADDMEEDRLFYRFRAIDKGKAEFNTTRS